MKESAKSIVRQVAFEVPEIASKLSWVSHAYVPLRTARMPANASLVTLIDMCSRPIGKRGCGSAEIQQRNSSCTSSGSVARYESRVSDNHHHVVCRGCGAIADVDCAVGETPCLTAAVDHGFVLDEAEVIYWGRCPDCST
jgi:hypothetical protein